MARKKKSEPVKSAIEQLHDRVEAGRKWLAEHDSDPPGRFYLWWQAKLRPGQPMPAQPKEVQDRYAEWHRGFSAWLRLYAQLERESETDYQSPS